MKIYLFSLSFQEEEDITKSILWVICVLIDSESDLFIHLFMFSFIHYTKYQQLSKKNIIQWRKRLEGR